MSLTELPWLNALQGPRSLGTAPDCAIAVIEDPGIVEIQAQALGDSDFPALSERLGFDLPQEPWSSAQTGDVLALWVGPGSWWLLVPRPSAADLHALVPSADLTGAHAALKLVGPAAGDILMRLCPLALATIPAGEARGTSVSGVRVVLYREPGSVESLLLLVPRSFAEPVARTLVKTARDSERLNLFEPAPAPLV